ncbi:glycosyltransferase [Parabacteroides sp. OttesenSCG-928-G21]|nr:glycosyltransferase [Parabacteroides sp. OttesenSCG-928-G21]
MEDGIKISVIIPVYNVEPYVERCLCSVLDQTYQNIEIIVVDDCGTDNSMQIVERVVAEHENGQKVIILSQEENRGLSAARNRGIHEAKGEYIWFMDSDDEIKLDCLEKIVAPVLKYGDFEMVIGDYYKIYESSNSRIDGPGLLLKSGQIVGQEEIMKTYFGTGWYCSAWNRLLKKEFLIKNNLYFYEGIIMEDYLWMFMLVIVLSKVYITNEAIYLYRQRAGSITKNVVTRKMQSLIVIYKIIKDYGRENRIFDFTLCVSYIERGKTLNLIELITSSVSVKEKKKWYKRIRQEDIFPKRKDYLFVFKYKKKKDVFLGMHYLCPPSIGFYYLYFLYPISKIYKFIGNVRKMR